MGKSLDGTERAAPAEREALIRALKAQVRALQHTLAQAERTATQTVEHNQALRAQLAEATGQLRQIHASRHWRWMTRYWLFRSRLLKPYRALRQYLRQVIPHETRARVLVLLGRQPAPAVMAPPVPKPGQWPALTGTQTATLQRLLAQLGLPDVPADYFDTPPGRGGLSAGQQADLRTLLDFLAAAGSPAPRLVAAGDLPPAPPAPRRRLLFICGEFPNTLSGGGGAVFNLIRAQSRDHDIYLCAWYQPAQDEAALAAVRPFCKAIRLVTMQAMESGQLDLLLDPLGMEPADIVHYYWPRALACYSRGLGRHHLFTHVEAVGLRLLKDLQRAEPQGAAWRQTLGALLSALKVELVDTDQLSARIAVTALDGEFLSGLAPRLPCVVLGVPVDFAATALPEQPPEAGTLVFVGNYLHYPNVDAAVYFCREILPRVRQAYPGARLYVVGAQPTPAVKALHDGEAVIVTGSVPDVRPYIQRATVCVAPLVTGAGMRTKINFYAALKRVCVATALATVELPYRHGQEVWVADDPAAFAQHVVDMLNHPEQARAMGLAAYAAACAQYDLPVITERFYRLYQALDGPAFQRGGWPAANGHEA